MSINSVATFLDKFETQQNPNAAMFDAKGTLDQGGQFDYRLLTTLNYSFTGGTSVGLQWRYLPSIADETAAQDPATRILGVGSYSEFDMFARYPISEKTRASRRNGQRLRRDAAGRRRGSGDGDDQRATRTSGTRARSSTTCSAGGSTSA